ncbi:MAG: divergent polysaccharide deacetylase family protein [Candidatus Krumholzibacteriia bacterium]
MPRTSDSRSRRSGRSGAGARRGAGRSKRPGGSGTSGAPRWLVVGIAGGALLLGLLAAGILGWSRTDPGQSALLRLGSDRMYPLVQRGIEEALRPLLPDLWCGPAAGGGAPASAHDWTHTDDSGAPAAIRCRVVAAPAGATFWEVQQQVAEAVMPLGARILWAERLPRTDAGATTSCGAGLDAESADLLRLDLGVIGRPTHTLVVHAAATPAPVVHWTRDAVASAWDILAAGSQQPTIAIVIDDWGFFHSRVTEGLLALPVPLTAAVLPGLPYSRRFALAATELALPPADGAAHLTPGRRDAAREARRAAGCPVEISLGSAAPELAGRRREVILHLPMEPEGYPAVDPGPLAITVGMSEVDIAAVVDHALAGLPGVTGVNNHMGSRATADRATMSRLMRVLRERGLHYVDSLTTPRSVAYAEAQRAGLASARSRIFLDEGRPDAAGVRRNLDALVRAARAGGFAVGIGHPHAATLEALAAELPRLAAAGVRFVTVSELIALQTLRDASAAS